MPMYDVYIDGYLCYTLLHKGPCKSNNWLVANKSADKPSTECRRRICEENEVHFRDECRHKNDSNTLCGESQIILINPFGEGMLGPNHLLILMADLRQNINRVSSFSRCLNGTFP